MATLQGLRAERAWGGSLDVTRRPGPLELNATGFASTVRNPVRLETTRSGGVAPLQRRRRHAHWGSEAMGRYRAGAFLAIATYAHTPGA